jgi:hypothetical protein
MQMHRGIAIILCETKSGGESTHPIIKHNKMLNLRFLYTKIIRTKSKLNKKLKIIGKIKITNIPIKNVIFNVT